MSQETGSSFHDDKCVCAQVWAIDLLGQGASDKPALEGGYSMELWGELLVDFLSEFTTQPPVLVGNSVGSLACLLVPPTPFASTTPMRVHTRHQSPCPSTIPALAILPWHVHMQCLCNTAH